MACPLFVLYVIRDGILFHVNSCITVVLIPRSMLLVDLPPTQMINANDLVNCAMHKCFEHGKYVQLLQIITACFVKFSG